MTEHRSLRDLSRIRARRVLTGTTLALLSTSALHGQAASDVVLGATAGSKLWIEGSSNVHDWACRATTFDARVEATSSPVKDRSGLAENLRSVTLSVAVRDLKCGNSRMDRDLYAALRATDPATPAEIRAVLASTGAVSNDGTVHTDGILSVAGVKHPCTVEVLVARGEDGLVRARGSLPLLMTDFGVTPPTGLFGLIRSRNEVMVKFDLLIPAQAIVAQPLR